MVGGSTRKNEEGRINLGLEVLDWLGPEQGFTC